MSRNSTTADSQTDWQRLRNMRDEDIDFSDLPEIREEDLRGAELRVAGKPIPEGKSFVGLLLDTDILEYFKSRASGDDLQGLINETLRSSMAKA